MCLLDLLLLLVCISVMNYCLSCEIVGLGGVLIVDLFLFFIIIDLLLFFIIIDDLFFLGDFIFLLLPLLVVNNNYRLKLINVLFKYNNSYLMISLLIFKCYYYYVLLVLILLLVFVLLKLSMLVI